MKMDRRFASSGGTVLAVTVIMFVWLSCVVFSWADGVTPTNEWINLYGRNSTVDGEPLPPGAVVSVFDSGGTKCGEIEVTVAGWYGLMPCYRAAAGSGGDGSSHSSLDIARDGKSLSFTVDGRGVEYVAVSLNATPVPPGAQVTWTALGDLWEVDLRSSAESRAVGGHSMPSRWASTSRILRIGVVMASGAGLAAMAVLLTQVVQSLDRDSAEG